MLIPVWLRGKEHYFLHNTVHAPSLENIDKNGYAEMHQCKQKTIVLHCKYWCSSESLQVIIKFDVWGLDMLDRHIFVGYNRRNSSFSFDDKNNSYWIIHLSVSAKTRLYDCVILVISRGKFCGQELEMETSDRLQCSHPPDKSTSGWGK